ncbi:MAG: Yip1 family protein [Deinococcota bacterium]
MSDNMSGQGMINAGNTQMFAVQLTAVIEDETKRMSAAEVLAQELGVEPDKVFKLISSAPKKISQAMPQVDAENMAALCQSAGLEVDLIAVQAKRPAARPQPRPAPVVAQPVQTASARASSSRSASAQREQRRPPSDSQGGWGGLPPFAVNPYFTMLTKPKDTLRTLLDGPYTNSDLSLVVLLGGLSTVLILLVVLGPLSTVVAAGLDAPAGAITGAAIVLALFTAISTIVSLYFTGFLYAWVGAKLFDGNGSYRDARFAYAWALIPGVWLNVIVFVLMIPTLPQIISSASSGVPASGSPLYGFASFLAFIGGFWILVVQCRALAEAHGFSAWKGFGTVLITGILSGLIIGGLQTIFIGILGAVLSVFV